MTEVNTGMNRSKLPEVSESMQPTFCFSVTGLSDIELASILEALVVQAEFFAQITAEGLPSHVALAEGPDSLAEVLANLPADVVIARGKITEGDIVVGDFISATHSENTEINSRRAVVSAEITITFEEE